jgi:hypothetical protein
MRIEKLRTIAFREAGAWLMRDADSNDLDLDTEEDEEKVREIIRQIAERLTNGQSVFR